MTRQKRGYEIKLGIFLLAALLFYLVSAFSVGAACNIYTSVDDATGTAKLYSLDFEKQQDSAVLDIPDFVSAQTSGDVLYVLTKTSLSKFTGTTAQSAITKINKNDFADAKYFAIISGTAFIFAGVNNETLIRVDLATGESKTASFDHIYSLAIDLVDSANKNLYLINKNQEGKYTVTAVNQDTLEITSSLYQLSSQFEVATAQFVQISGKYIYLFAGHVLSPTELGDGMLVRTAKNNLASEVREFLSEAHMQKCELGQQAILNNKLLCLNKSTEDLPSQLIQVNLDDFTYLPATYEIEKLYNLMIFDMANTEVYLFDKQAKKFAHLGQNMLPVLEKTIASGEPMPLGWYVPDKNPFVYADSVQLCAQNIDTFETSGCFAISKQPEAIFSLPDSACSTVQTECTALIESPSCAKASSEDTYTISFDAAAIKCIGTTIGYAITDSASLPVMSDVTTDNYQVKVESDVIQQEESKDYVVTLLINNEAKDKKTLSCLQASGKPTGKASLTVRILDAKKALLNDILTKVVLTKSETSVPVYRETGTGGEYSIQNLETGTYTIIAAGKGYISSVPKKIELKEGENTIDIVLEEQPAPGTGDCVYSYQTDYASVKNLPGCRTSFCGFCSSIPVPYQCTCGYSDIEGNTGTTRPPYTSKVCKGIRDTEQLDCCESRTDLGKKWIRCYKNGDEYTQITEEADFGKATFCAPEDIGCKDYAEPKKCFDRGGFCVPMQNPCPESFHSVGTFECTFGATGATDVQDKALGMCCVPDETASTETECGYEGKPCCASGCREVDGERLVCCVDSNYKTDVCQKSCGANTGIVQFYQASYTNQVKTEKVEFIDLNGKTHTIEKKADGLYLDKIKIVSDTELLKQIRDQFKGTYVETLLTKQTGGGSGGGGSGGSSTCSIGASLEGRSVPGTDAIITTFGGPDDASAYRKSGAFGDLIDGSTHYCAMQWPYYRMNPEEYQGDAEKEWWHNKKILIEANGKSIVVPIQDWGPHDDVIKAAGKQVIDVSPLTAEYLFGQQSFGWSSGVSVKVSFADQSLPIGPAENCGAGEGGGTGTLIGNYAWPTSSRHITSCFGWRDLCEVCPKYYNCHQGLDISGNIGDPVYSVDDGEVVTAVNHAGTDCGIYVTIKHSGGQFYSTYCHLSKIIVSSGQVKKGQKIAEVGDTDTKGSPHLHVTFSTDGSLASDVTRINPACLFGDWLSEQNTCGKIPGNNGRCGFSFSCTVFVQSQQQPEVDAIVKGGQIKDDFGKTATTDIDTVAWVPCTDGKSHHQGIDIVTYKDNKFAEGAEIRAYKSGTVQEVYKEETKCYKSGVSAGNYIRILSDDNTYYRYLHMKYGSIPDSIVVGASVQAGDIIGTIGNTGTIGEDCNYYHLHFDRNTGGGRTCDAYINPFTGKTLTDTITG